MKGGKRMGNNTADTSAVNAVPASDSAAKRLTGDERRREILAAVRTVSSELGVSHLSVSAVTKRAGCTRSLFYHYFQNKEEVTSAEHAHLEQRRALRRLFAQRGPARGAVHLRHHRG